MVNPIISKVPAKPLDSVAEQGEGVRPKTGESKFDKVRTRLQDQQAEQVQIPSEVKQISLQQKKVLEADLTKRLGQPGATSPQKIFAVDMKRAKVQVDQLTNRVNALPKTPAFEPLRQRLTSIDSQFQSAGQLLHSLKGTENAGELMKVQVQMYQLTENLELMSKVVEQVTSGVKSILQTQV
jgi:hypothetical protein